MGQKFLPFTSFSKLKVTKIDFYCWAFIVMLIRDNISNENNSSIHQIHLISTKFDLIR